MHLAPEDVIKTGEASEIEMHMLELDDNVSEYSRLSCQIEMLPLLPFVVRKSVMTLYLGSGLINMIPSYKSWAYLKAINS